MNPQLCEGVDSRELFPVESGLLRRLLRSAAGAFAPGKVVSEGPVSVGYASRGVAMGGPDPDERMLWSFIGRRWKPRFHHKQR